VDINGKVVVVTGAGRGLGRAIAETLAARGARLACVDLNEDDLRDTVARCEQAGGKAKRYLANVASESEVTALFENVVADFGAVHGLVNNAGITRDGLLVKARDGEVQSTMSLQQWQAVIDVNLTGVFLCGREAAAAMVRLGVEEGVIVNISSIARHGSFGQTNYAAAKAGVVAMAEVWARELARYNVRTGVVAPGTINTDMIAAMKPEARDRLVGSVPLKRLGEPEHIAKSVLFIFENDYFTGRVIETDGGLR
tara:strand:+ start:18869 stop:19630 length:762 start_codon:yes stop_codon:yes gene_type:complete